eukprot:gene6187-6822_t
MDPSQSLSNPMDDPRDSNPFHSENIVLTDAMIFNMKQMELFQIVLYMAAGSIAGILGLTGKWGLVLLLVNAVISTLALWIFRMKLSMKKYSNQSFLSLAMLGLQNQALTFIFFWTFAYTMVHIY